MDNWAAYCLPGESTNIAYRIRQAPKGRSAEKMRFVSLWFQDNPEEPFAAAKWTLNQGMFDKIRQEYRFMLWLREVKNVQFVPKPLGCPEISGVPVLIERAVQGRSFAHSLIALEAAQDSKKFSQYFEEILLKAEEILKQIQDPLEPVSKQEVLEEVDSFFFRAEKILEWSEEKSREIKRVLNSFPFGTIPGSGDALLIGAFAPRNILTGSSGTFLIDLEFSRRSKLAFLDSLFFTFSLFKFLHKSFEENSEETVSFFQEKILKGENEFGKRFELFLRSRSILKENFEWYWLIFLLYEVVYLDSISDLFLPSYRFLFNCLIDLLIG